MIYAVLFEDNDSHADMRTRYMPDHLTFLERNSDKVQAAGPLKDTAEDTAAGGLWLVQAENPESVQALVEADPFWPTGLRKSVRVLAWTRMFEAARR